MARKCPRCGCSDVRRSTIHSVDEEQLHVFLSPYRCNECDERFWVISRRARQMAIGLLVLAVTGVTVALLMGGLATPQLRAPTQSSGGAMMVLNVAA